MRYKLKFILAAVITTCFLLLTGCWNNNEISDLLLVKAIGIDKDNLDYVVTIQVINPQLSGVDSYENSYETITYTQRDSNLFVAVRKLYSMVPRKLHMSHLDFLLIGESYAHEGLQDMLDYFLREYQFRVGFNVLVTKNTSAQYVIESLSKPENSLSIKLLDVVDLSSKIWSPVSSPTFIPFLQSLIRDGDNLTLPCVEVTNDGSIRVSSMGIFFESKLIGWLSTEESVGLNFIKDNIRNTFLRVNYRSVPFTIDVYKSKTSVSVDLSGDVPVFSIDVETKGAINSVGGKVPWVESEIYGSLESSCNKKIKVLIEDVLAKTQLEYESDIFGFGEMIHIKNRKYWNSIKGEWSEFFQNIKVEINVSTTVDRSDKILKTIKSR